jgi:hypothetical protein
MTNARAQLIALVLAGYGIWTALYVPALLVGPPTPLLLVCFVLQAIAALMAAVAVWQDRGWAAAPILVLGAAIAATQLIEVLLGIVPYLRAVLLAVLAIVAALLLVGFTRHGARSTTRP